MIYIYIINSEWCVVSSAFFNNSQRALIILYSLALFRTISHFPNAVILCRAEPIGPRFATFVTSNRFLSKEAFDLGSTVRTSGSSTGSKAPRCKDLEKRAAPGKTSTVVSDGIEWEEVFLCKLLIQYGVRAFSWSRACILTCFVGLCDVWMILVTCTSLHVLQLDRSWSCGCYSLDSPALRESWRSCCCCCCCCCKQYTVYIYIYLYTVYV